MHPLTLFRQLPLLTGITIWIFLLSGCEKNNQNTATPKTSFSYSGNLVVWDTIRFQSNLPSDYTLYWKFDSSSPGLYNSPQVSHVFTKVGKHSVCLLSGHHSGFVTDSETQMLTIDVNPKIQQCLQKITGTHSFHCVSSSGAYGQPSVINSYNQNITVNIIDDERIALSITTDMLSIQSYTGGNLTYFCNPSGSKPHPRKLDYDQTKDQITISVDDYYYGGSSSLACTSY